MKLLKTFATFICGLIIIIVATSWLWYGVQPADLSFFINGKGEPYVDIKYYDNGGKEQTVSIYPILSGTPLLQNVELEATNIKSVKLNIKHYDGPLHISDVFIQGIRFTQMKALGNNVTVISNSAENISLDISENNTEISICDDCMISNPRVFKPYVFCGIICVYLFLCLLCGIFYLFRNKIKQKMMNVYTLKNYSLILPYIKPYWFRTLIALVITIPVGSMDAVIAWSLKPFMDVVLVEKQEGWTSYIPLMIIIFSILQAVFTYIATYMNTWVGNRIALDIKRKLFDKLIHNDAAFFDKTDSGNVLMRFNKDAEMACSGLLNSMRLFSTRFFSSLSLIIVLFYNSWKLAVVAVLVMVFAFYPAMTVRKRMKHLVKMDVNFMAAIFAHYNEVFSGNRIVSAYNLFEFYKNKFMETANGLVNMMMQMMRRTGIVAPLMHTITSFGIAAVIWYGSYLIVNHQITVGNFASFITSLVMLYNPLKSIGGNITGVIMSMMAVERVFQTLDLQPEVQNSATPLKLHNCKGDIRYDNVSFSYVKDKNVLNNINLDIKSGQTIALVGNSGGGKTTVSALLPRFYDVKQGAITIDGINIKDIDLDNLRDNIAIVFQDNFLFGGTIRDNIIFNRTDISEEELQQAINSACLDEFINGLEHGLQTQIGERGVMLSGGQKQRIAIARAFIKNAPILILDEATSALDNKAEAVVQQAIDNLMKDRTVLVIAHRLSTVRNADCIVVINNGEIVEKGTHEELIKQDGEYAALYKTQLV